jgi:hypothetical protein
MERVKGERSGLKKQEKPVFVRLVIRLSRWLRCALVAILDGHLRAHQLHQEIFAKYPME